MPDKRCKTTKDKVSSQPGDSNARGRRRVSFRKAGLVGALIGVVLFPLLAATGLCMLPFLPANLFASVTEVCKVVLRALEIHIMPDLIAVFVISAFDGMCLGLCFALWRRMSSAPFDSST
jgi:uncharacterized protein YqgC (DUF456 family)